MAASTRGEGHNFLPRSVPLFTAGELVHSYGIWAGTVTQFARALGTDRATIFRLVASGAVLPLTASGAAEHERACMSFVGSEFERLRKLIPVLN